MTILLAFLFLVNGAVMNETTGKPQPGATVTLYKLGQAGPESLESVKSGADGKYEINQAVQGPHLLQAAFDGVTYNTMLFPGRPTTGVDIKVYRTSNKPGSARVGTHMVLVEAGQGELSVSETYVWQNDGKSTFYDPAGGNFKFFLPEAAGGKVKVQCTHPGGGGIPIERAAEKTATAGVYKVDFPVKPGETRFDLSYTVAGNSFAGKTLYAGTPVRFVAPVGVALKGDALTAMGQHPETQATIYESKGGAYKIDVEGQGTLRAPEAESGDEDEGSGIQQIRPRIYDRFHTILGLTALILALGFILLYRKDAAAAGDRTE